MLSTSPSSSFSMTTLTVDDVLSVLFYLHPPPAVANLPRLQHEKEEKRSDKNGVCADPKKATEESESAKIKVTESDGKRAVPLTTTLSDAALSSMLSSYATEIASLAYRTTGLVLAPSTVAAAVVNVFLPSSKNDETRNLGMEQHWQGVMSTLKKAYDAFVSASTTASEHKSTHHSNHKKHPRNEADVALLPLVEDERVKRQRLDDPPESSTHNREQSHTIDSHRASLPGLCSDSSRSATAFLGNHQESLSRSLLSAPRGDNGANCQTATAEEDDEDDPTSPRRPFPPASVSSVLSQSNNNAGDLASAAVADGRSDTSALHASTRARTSQTSHSADTQTSETVATVSSAPVPATPLAESALANSSSSTLTSHQRGGNGEMEQGNREIKNHASLAAEEDDEEDLTPSDKLWRSIATPTADLKQQLHRLRFETPLTPEALFFIIQNSFFLVPGSDVFLAPVPPNTIMEFNEVKSESYDRIIFAPLSLMDVKVAVKQSRRRFYRCAEQGQQQSQREGVQKAMQAGPTDFLHAGNAGTSLTGADATATTPFLPFALSATDDRVLTLADLERSVWHIASNCAMFNAPESFYPLTGRNFALGCVAALVRYAKDQLRKHRC